jgi:WD40 repeat protein
MWSLALSPDGKRVVSTNSLGKIFVNNAEDGGVLLQFDNVDPAGTSAPRIDFRTLWNIAFFPDGRTFATADRGGLVRIWDTNAGTLVKSIPVEAGHVVRALAISPDGNLIACSTDLGNAPNKLLVWNLERAEFVHEQVTATRTFTLAFSRDGRTLLGENYNGAANLWKVAANGALLEARRIGFAGDRTIDVAFSSDEKSVFAVGDGAAGQLTQWDITTGEELWRSPRLEQGLAWQCLVPIAS